MSKVQVLTNDNSDGLSINYPLFTINIQGVSITLQGNDGEIKNIEADDLEFILNWDVAELTYDELIKTLEND